MICGIGFITIVASFHCLPVDGHRAHRDSVFLPVTMMTASKRRATIHNKGHTHHELSRAKDNTAVSGTNISHSSADAMVFKFISSSGDQEQNKPQMKHHEAKPPATPRNAANNRTATELYRRMLKKARHHKDDANDRTSQTVKSIHGQSYVMPPPPTPSKQSPHKSKGSSDRRQELQAKVERLSRQNAALQHAIQRLLRIMDRMTSSDGAVASRGRNNKTP